MKETNFEDWDWEDLIRAFGLKREKQTPLLTEWTQSRREFTELETQLLLSIQDEALLRGNALNEDEVKFRFIAPIIRLAGFPSEPYSVFTQRPISCQIGNYLLTGKPDFMLASGFNTPREPFFFLQEYKPVQLRNKLPMGQALAAMLAAQELNGENHPHPILGATVIATTWNFIVLEGRSFSFSPDFSLNTDDIFKIVAILSRVNDYVLLWIEP